MSVRASDKSVRKTADDAAVSKLSAVSRGYYNDDFLKLFVRKSARRPPLINRGYYARVAAFDKLVQSFLGHGDGKAASKQIVCLGSGLDTTFFRLAAAGQRPASYVELDLADNVRTKVGLIKRSDELKAAVGGDIRIDTCPDAPSLRSAGYNILTADLRNLSAVQTALTDAKIDLTVPTLFLSECVLIYVPVDDSNALLSWIASSFQSVVVVAYEQILPDDAFGQMMQKNLAARNIVLHGLSAHPDIPSQSKRFMDRGFNFTRVWDMNDVYYKFLPRAEVARVERLELFDELEEWHLMQAHYVIAVAVRDSASLAGQEAPSSKGDATPSGAGEAAGQGEAGAGSGAGTGAGAGSTPPVGSGVPTAVATQDAGNGTFSSALADALLFVPAAVAARGVDAKRGAASSLESQRS